MKRWDWIWEETEETPELFASSAPARRRRSRRALAAAAVVVVAAVTVLLVTTGASPGGHSPATAAGAPSVVASGHARHRVQPAAAEDRIIDAVLRRQAVVVEGAGHAREVALTFDDGPGPYTAAVLAALHRLRVRATFFPIGQMERYFAAGTRSERRAGEVIGDHTQTHPLLARLTAARQRAEIVGQTLSMSMLSVPYPRLFRPPYGSYDATTLSVLRRLHMLLVLWSIDTQDYTRPGVAAIVRRALAGVRPGSIILMHDGGGDRSQTVAALPLIVRGLRRRHLHPVTVPRLLRDDPPVPGVRIPFRAVTERAPGSPQPGA